ncbi:helix-turn-helix domain-containing protein [Streptomyces sp. XY332]|uniref:helix-turn-helix domain-containing protein n=1 Tax=Streptomyces sp. XY332 TaxID=1415561 RepID=UPI003B6363CD
MSGSPVPPLKRPELAEARRVHAVELFGQGCSNAEIAGMVGVHAESVRRWRRAWENGGAQALRRRPAPGRRHRLFGLRVHLPVVGVDVGIGLHLCRPAHPAYPYGSPLHPARGDVAARRSRLR